MNPFNFIFFIGLLTGLLLERSGLLAPHYIIPQLRLKQHRILVTACTAIITHLCLLIMLDALDMITLHGNFLLPYASLIGGSLIGCGVAIACYYPARDRGVKPAIGLFGCMAVVVAFLLGSRFGIQFFFVIYPDLPAYYFTNYTLNRPMLHEVLGLPFIPVALGVIILLLLAIKWLQERYDER